MGGAAHLLAATVSAREVPLEMSVGEATPLPKSQASPALIHSATDAPWQTSPNLLRYWRFGDRASQAASVWRIPQEGFVRALR